MHMGQTIGGGRAIRYDPVEFVGVVSLNNTGVSIQNRLRISRVLRIGIIVEDVRKVCITAVNPNESLICFTETLFNDWQFCGIRLHNATFEDPLFHALYDRIEQTRYILQPPTHTGAVNRKTKSAKDLFLTVGGQMESEFVGTNFSEKTRSGLTFVDGLIWLRCGDNLSFALSAGIFVHDQSQSDILHCGFPHRYSLITGIEYKC